MRIHSKILNYECSEVQIKHSDWRAKLVANGLLFAQVKPIYYMPNTTSISSYRRAQSGGAAIGRLARG